jgi:TonB family protein
MDTLNTVYSGVANASMRALLFSIVLFFAAGGQADEVQIKREQYLATVHKKVARIAPKSRDKREVTVAVDIESSGHLSALRIEKSSGDPAVDESALRAVVAASPFGALPAELRPRITGVQVRFYTDHSAK